MRVAVGMGHERRGMTLLEVLLAMAIALFSLVAISQLFNSATDQAIEIQFKSRATRLAQSKLAEFTTGIYSLSSGGSGTFDEEPEWSWTAEAQAPTDLAVTNASLYLLTVTVSRESPQGHIETKLSQYVIDPKLKGTINPSSASGSSGSSGSGSSGTSPSATTTTPTGASP